MELNGIALIVLLAAAATLVSCLVSSLRTVLYLQRHHPQVWEDLGKPSGPAGFSGANYPNWVMTKGYLSTGDTKLIRSCRFQTVAPYLATALATMGAPIHYFLPNT
jgi:hypothetical protein